MRQNGQWDGFPLFCVNCGEKLLGYRNKVKRINYQCSQCGCRLEREDLSRRHSIINVYAPPITPGYVEI